MLLCVDIGNSNIKFCGYSENKLRFVATVATELQHTFEQQAIKLRDLLNLYEIPTDCFRGAAVSSVVPSVTKKITDAIEFICGVKALLVSPGIKTGIVLRGSNIAEMGSDIVCTAVGMVNQYPLPCIAISLGTATTVLVVNQQKELIGGMIIPGMVSSFAALSGATSKLPKIGIEEPTELLSLDTSGAMNAGIVYGTAAMLDGLAKKICKQIGDSTLVLSGGLSRMMLPYLEQKFIIDEHIVLKGLKYIYEKNEKR